MPGGERMSDVSGFEEEGNRAESALGILAGVIPEKDEANAKRYSQNEYERGGYLF